MAGFLIAISCLNEAEWQGASHTLTFHPDDREALQYVMRTLDGPKGIADSLVSEPGEPPLTFINTAIECKLRMKDGPAG